MPDLDQLLDTLVADVTAGTHAPGARSAITRARRGRAAVAVAATGAVASVAVVSAVATGAIGGSDQPSPLGEPTTPATSPAEPPTVWETAGSPAALYDLGQELDAILTTVPGWDAGISEGYPEGYDYAFNGQCAGGWSRAAESGSDGGAPAPSAVGAGIGSAGFSSALQASDAAAVFVENLATCKKFTWRAQPIAQTGAVLASSATAVAWIQQVGDTVRVLQVATPDGPPPLDVQVGVADWMVAYDTWQEQAAERR